jgi:hypothetical protein
MDDDCGDTAKARDEHAEVVEIPGTEASSAGVPFSPGYGRRPLRSRLAAARRPARSPGLLTAQQWIQSAIAQVLLRRNAISWLTTARQVPRTRAVVECAAGDIVPSTAGTRPRKRRRACRAAAGLAPQDRSAKVELALALDQRVGAARVVGCRSDANSGLRRRARRSRSDAHGYRR